MLWKDWVHVPITEWITVAKGKESSDWLAFHGTESHTKEAPLIKWCAFARKKNRCEEAKQHAYYAAHPLPSIVCK